MRKLSLIILTLFFVFLALAVFSAVTSCGDNIHPVDAAAGERLPEGEQAPGGIGPTGDASPEAETKAACCRGLLESEMVPFECGVPPGQCRMFICGGTYVAGCNR